MPPNDDKVASKLFGAIRRLPATGDHRPSPEQLSELARLPDSDSFEINQYCAGCGEITHPNRHGLEILSKKAGIPVPENMEGKYFQVRRCILCSEDDTEEEPELKEARLQ